MKDEQIAKLIRRYRQGYLTAIELVAILEQKLYNANYEEKGFKDTEIRKN